MLLLTYSVDAAAFTLRFTAGVASDFARHNERGHLRPVDRFVRQKANIADCIYIYTYIYFCSIYIKEVKLVRGMQFYAFIWKLCAIPRR